MKTTLRCFSKVVFGDSHGLLIRWMPDWTCQEVRNLEVTAFSLLDAYHSTWPEGVHNPSMMVNLVYSCRSFVSINAVWRL